LIREVKGQRVLTGQGGKSNGR